MKTMISSNDISRRRLLLFGAAACLFAGAPAMADYDHAANPADDSGRDIDPAAFTIAEADNPSTGLAFWQTADASEAADLAARLLDDSRWQGPRFVAAAFYSALDGKRAALYGQWAGGRACEAGLDALAVAARAKPNDAGIFKLAGRFPAGISIPIKAEGVAAFREYWTNARQQDELLSRELSAVAWQSGDEGVLSASIHRALRGTRVVSYLQIDDDHADVARKRLSESFGEHWREIERSDCRLYDIVFVMAAQGARSQKPK